MAIKYTQEFKQTALRLCEHKGVEAVGEKLGVSTKTLYWNSKERPGNAVKRRVDCAQEESLERSIGAVHN